MEEQDEANKELIKIAKEHGIEIVENQETVDSLFMLDIGEYIPESLFEIVAEILAFVYTMENR